MASSTPTGSPDMARDQSPTDTPSDQSPTDTPYDQSPTETPSDQSPTEPPATRTDPDLHRGDDVDPVRDTDTGTHRPVDSAYVIKRQKAQFGGMKIGACFFGWLTAAGTAVILTAVVAAVLGAIGMNLAPNTLDPNTVGITSAIALIAVVFVAYLAGGYVAGRMARFNGMKQGLGVWLWAIVIAIVAVILGVVAGRQFDLTGQAIGVPQIPFDPAGLTTRGILTVLAVLAASLVGAIVGGLAGMRYHRRIDHRTDLAQD